MSLKSDNPQLPVIALHKQLNEDLIKNAWSYHKIFLSRSKLKNSRQKQFVYFISPYCEIPPELIKQMGWILVFDQNYLQQHTEHKEVIFNFPFVMGDYSAVKIKLIQSNYLLFKSIFQFIQTEIKDVQKHADKLIVSGINILFLKASRMAPSRNIEFVNHHYTSLLITSRFRSLLFQSGIPMQRVHEYASALNLTPNYLNLVLKSVTGKNASEHIAEVIIVQTKYYLIHTKLSLKEVSDKMGFSSATYFTRFFKKQTGFKPLEWFNLQIRK